jgi:hypothetical protein
LVIRKLKQLLEKEDYSYDKENTETERLYRLKSDPIALFSKEMVVGSEDDCRKMVMYDAYTKWCIQNAIEVKAENVFAKRFGKMHEAGREAAPGPDGERKRVWLSCSIRPGSVRVNFDNPDDKKTITGDITNGENNSSSKEIATCLSRSEKKSCQEKNSPYGTTYRGNPDGLGYNEDKNTIKQSNNCSSGVGVSNPDANPDGFTVNKQNKEVGQYQKDTDFYSMEKMIKVKIEHYISKYEKENRPINKANLTEAKHMIAHWAKIEPSRVEAWIMKLCKMA